MTILRKIIGLLTGDLTGRSRTRQEEHPYFGSMTYFDHEDPSKAYWEAEVPIGEPPGKVSVTMSGTSDGPTAAEEAFCRGALEDLDRLFDRCREVFGREYEQWASQPMPGEWRDSFELDGLSIPTAGDDSGEWEVTYFVPPANHWFTARIADGRAHGVYVDG